MKYKDKKCKHCKALFPQRKSTEVVCSLGCAIAQGKLVEAKKLKAANQELKKELKVLKNKVTDWKSKLQFKINQIVRLIDQGQPCLARGYKIYQMHAGHVYSRGAFSNIRYHLHNIHRQSAQSNHWQNDDARLRDGIIKEYGSDYYKYIESLQGHPVVKIDYQAKYVTASEIYLCLRKMLKEPLPLQLRLDMRDLVNEQLGIYEM